VVARRVVDLVALVVRAGVLVVDLRVVDPRVVERREVLVPLERLASARALALRRDAVIFRVPALERTRPSLSCALVIPPGWGPDPWRTKDLTS